MVDQMIVYYLGFVIVILFGIIVFAFPEIKFKVLARSLSAKGKTVIFFVNENKVIEPRVISLKENKYNSDKDHSHMIIKSDQYRYNNLPAYIVSENSGQTINVADKEVKLDSGLLKNIILKVKASSVLSDLMKDIKLQKILAIATAIGIAVLLYYGWTFLQDVNAGKYCMCVIDAVKTITA